MGLYTLLVIRMEARNKIERKCFLSVPVIHEPSNGAIQPGTCQPQLSYSHLPVVGGPPPYNTAAEQQASSRTLRDRRTMYSHTGQYDHTLSKKQLYHVTHSLHPEDFTTNISLRLKFKNSDLYQYTRSRLITEVKHRRAWIVLGWGCIPS